MPVVSSINNLTSVPGSPPVVSVILKPSPSLTVMSKAKLFKSLSSILIPGSPEALICKGIKAVFVVPEFPIMVFPTTLSCPVTSSLLTALGLVVPIPTLPPFKYESPLASSLIVFTVAELNRSSCP